MPSIFVSYSPLDHRWVDENYPFALIPWLENVLRWDGASLWYDRSDPASAQSADGFEVQVLEAIDCADMALLLISPAFFGSDSVNRVELPHILQRAERGDLVVIPILLEACDWHSRDYLASRQMLPDGPTPLSDYTGCHLGWEQARTLVLAGIRCGLQEAAERKALLTPPPPMAPPLPRAGPPAAARPLRALWTKLAGLVALALFVALLVLWLL